MNIKKIKIICKKGCSLRSLCNHAAASFAYTRAHIMRTREYAKLYAKMGGETTAAHFHGAFSRQPRK